MMNEGGALFYSFIRDYKNYDFYLLVEYLALYA